MGDPAGQGSPRRSLAPGLRRRIELGLALGMDRERGPLGAIGAQKRPQIGKTGVAALGHQSGDVIDALALARAQTSVSVGAIRSESGALAGHAD